MKPSHNTRDAFIELQHETVYMLDWFRGFESETCDNIIQRLIRNAQLVEEAGR